MLARRKDSRKSPGDLMEKLHVNAAAMDKLDWERKRAEAIISEEQKKIKTLYQKPMEYRCTRCRWSKSGVVSKSRFGCQEL